MSTYCTLAQIQALLPKEIRVDETTEPTDDQVTSWITQVSARVDLALLDGGHTSPATDATQLSAFSLLAAQEIAWMVMYRNNAATADHEWHKAFEAALVKLAAGDMAVSGNVVHAPSSRTMDAVDEATADSIEPKFSWDRIY